MRHAASTVPLSMPCVSSAWRAYSEHVGVNLHDYATVEQRVRNLLTRLSERL